MYEMTVETIEISPELATQWLSERTFIYQRSLKRKTVALYADQMKRGTWEPYSTLQVCRVGEDRFLIDGQHRLAAVITSGCSQRFSVMERVVHDLKEVARIYTRTDKGLLRTLYDDFSALDLADEFDLTATQLSEFSAALAFLNSGFRKSVQKSWHFDDRLTLMKEYLDAYREYLDAIKGAGHPMTSRLARAATLSVGLVSYRYSSSVYDTVDAFWNGVASDDGLGASDPRKYCVRHLLLVGMMGGGSTSASFTSHQHVSVSARRIAGYFNAHVEGRELKQDVKVLDYSAPIKILGSPFTGK